jgi:hypothetical protein
MRRRFEAELQDLREHYDGRLAKLHSVVRKLESDHQADLVMYEGLARAYRRQAGEEESDISLAGDEASDDWPGNNSDGDGEGLPAVGSESPSDEAGEDSGDLEGSEPGPEDEEVPEISGPMGADLHSGSVEPDHAKPYAISRAAFGEMASEGFQMITLTYYASDKVLTDDKDQPITSVVQTVGPLDPLGFGGISEDPYIRYVRNHKLEIDFEIVMNMGSYADIVLNYGQRRDDGNR